MQCYLTGSTNGKGRVEEFRPGLASLVCYPSCPFAHEVDILFFVFDVFFLHGQAILYNVGL